MIEFIAKAGGGATEKIAAGVASTAAAVLAPLVRVWTVKEWGLVLVLVSRNLNTAM